MKEIEVIGVTKLVSLSFSAEHINSFIAVINFCQRQIEPQKTELASVVTYLEKELPQ